jgi:1-deoxy-D-xylulose-5-phosphate synthase
MSGKTFNAAREGGRQKVLGFAPPLLELARRAEEHVKGMIAPGTLFEEFGFNYIGPIDGHDLDALIPTLQNLRDLKGPQIPARHHQEGPRLQAGRSRPDPLPRRREVRPGVGIKPARPGKLTYTQVFGDWLCDMAGRFKAGRHHPGDARRLRPGALRRANMPDRYFDVGIAEQHAVTFAAGLACEGLKPVVAIYSTFLQRAYDQLMHDVALQNLPVVFAHRPRRSGRRRRPDAPRHLRHFLPDLHPEHGGHDPGRRAECRQMLSTAYALDGPSMPCATRAAAAPAYGPRS